MGLWMSVAPSMLGMQSWLMSITTRTKKSVSTNIVDTLLVLPKHTHVCISLLVVDISGARGLNAKIEQIRLFADRDKKLCMGIKRSRQRKDASDSQ